MTDTEGLQRSAIVRGVDVDRVRAYLPANYSAELVLKADQPRADEFLIKGHDNAGWTLDGYVIPRLASGLISAVEVAQR